MKQYVKVYSNIYYAQDEMNKMIEKGWRVKNINMTNGHEYNGVSRNPEIMTEKIIVLFEKDDELLKKDVCAIGSSNI